MFSLWSKNHSTPSIVSAMKMFTAFSEWSNFPTGVIELFLKPRRAFRHSDNGIWGKILDDFVYTCGWEIHTLMRSLIGQQDSFFRPPEVIKPIWVSVTTVGLWQKVPLLKWSRDNLFTTGNSTVWFFLLKQLSMDKFYLRDIQSVFRGNSSANFLSSLEGNQPFIIVSTC